MRVLQALAMPGLTFLESNLALRVREPTVRCSTHLGHRVILPKQGLSILVATQVLR